MHFLKLVVRTIRAETLITDLSCNFDDGNLCNWQSDSNVWLIGVNVPIDSRHFIPHPINHNGLYVYAKGGTSILAEGHLISAEVRKHNNELGEVLSFYYWKSRSFSKLDVCIARQKTLECLYTAPHVADDELSWIKQTIILPNSLSIPFKIVFRARNIYTPSDIVAVDEIEWNVRSSRAFASSLLSSSVKKSIDELTRKMADEITITAACIPVRSLEGLWQQAEGYLTLGDKLAKSEYFFPPTKAFLEMNVWMSDDAILTVLEERIHGNKSIIWKQKGFYDDDISWQPLHIPLSASEQPIRILLQGIVPLNNFIMINNTKLANNNGNEIGCYFPHPVNFRPIKSLANDPERLIAYQQLQDDQVVLKTITRANEELPPLVRSLLPNISSTSSLYAMTKINPILTVVRDSKRNNNRYFPLANNGNHHRFGYPSETTSDPSYVPVLQTFQQQHFTPISRQYNRGLAKESIAVARLMQNKPSAQNKLLIIYLLRIIFKISTELNI